MYRLQKNTKHRLTVIKIRGEHVKMTSMSNAWYWKSQKI